MRNHDEAFTGLKNFYNDITSENLNLIRAQKAEITKIEELRAANIKKIAKYSYYLIKIDYDRKTQISKNHLMMPQQRETNLKTF